MLQPIYQPYPTDTSKQQRAVTDVHLFHPLGEVVLHKLVGCDSFHHDGHEGVVGPTQLRALPVEHTRALDGQPHLRQTRQAAAAAAAAGTSSSV